MLFSIHEAAPVMLFFVHVWLDGGTAAAWLNLHCELNVAAGAECPSQLFSRFCTLLLHGVPSNERFGNSGGAAMPAIVPPEDSD